MSGNVLVLEMNSTTVGLTTSAKDVKALSRTFQLELDELSYTVRMGAVGYVVSITFRQPCADKRDDSRSPAGTDLRSGGPGLRHLSRTEEPDRITRAAVERIWEAARHWYRAACSPRFSCACDTTAG